MKSSSTKSYLSIVSFFVHWKSIFFFPTFKEFGVNSIYKYASTTRLKSTTFALQYLGQTSSKLSPNPLVRKSSKAYFFELSSPSLVVAIFFISGFYLTINNYVFDHSNFPNIMSPGITVKAAVKTIAKQSESKSREIWRARFLDMLSSELVLFFTEPK